MTTTPTPADLQIQYEDMLDECGNDLDPVDPFAVIQMIADHGDIDLIDLIDRLLQGVQFKFGIESVIQDMLESSQSNLDRSLLSLRWMMILDNKIAEL